MRRSRFNKSLTLVLKELWVTARTGCWPLACRECAAVWRWAHGLWPLTRAPHSALSSRYSWDTKELRSAHMKPTGVASFSANPYWWMADGRASGAKSLRWRLASMRDVKFHNFWHFATFCMTDLFIILIVSKEILFINQWKVNEIQIHVTI